ncbi:UvrB/UvrC motif-containing protein [Christensenellaceae bacterium OttesenSCG-928-M15]|nr:UvrB/UvrC motif-containing protein [Christensenellaceae bacterium OttesenSCG-928-M15]
MLCDKCKQNQATVHTVSVVNGVKQEQYLCTECANNMEVNIPSLMEILSGFQYAPRTEQLPACECGMTLCAFQKAGLVGCAKCYDTFRRQLSPVIKRAQGGRTVHVGRRPNISSGAPEGASTSPEQAACPSTGKKEVDECVRLQEELKSAVQEERYERAAELRDRIRELKGGASS